MPDVFAGVSLSSSDELASDYARVLIHGPQGAGKTMLASTLAELGPMLFIDLIGEHGVRSFAGSPHAKNIKVVRPASITQLDDIFYALDSGKHDFKAVGIDSVTSLQKMCMRYFLGHDETAVREIVKGGNAKAGWDEWGQALNVMTDVATFWFGLADATRPKPMHVVMTAQTKVTEDESDGSSSLTPDVQRGAIPILLAAPDYILYCDMEDNPDAIMDESLPAQRHIVRFGSNSLYHTKGRVPYNLRGKIPHVLGRKAPLSLATLMRTLGVGGTDAPKARKTSTKTKVEE